MNAHEFLKQAQSEMQDRRATYDSAAGDRSMASTVEVFNALTGHKLNEEQGWKFMACLKLVRSEQGDYRADSFVDGAAYFGLAGEAAGRAKQVNSKTDTPNEPYRPKEGEDARTRGGFRAEFVGWVDRPDSPFVCIFTVDGYRYLYKANGKHLPSDADTHLDLIAPWEGE